MTAQIGESLRYQGEWVSMCSQPLGEYFAMLRVLQRDLRGQVFLR